MQRTRHLTAGKARDFLQIWLDVRDLVLAAVRNVHVLLRIDTDSFRRVELELEGFELSVVLESGRKNERKKEREIPSNELAQRAALCDQNDVSREYGDRVREL